MKNAYIESDTGIVWAVASKDFTVAEIAANIPEVDTKRTDAPDTLVGKASDDTHYHKWTGSEYELCWVIEELKAIKNQEIDIKTQGIIAEGIEYGGRTFPLELPDQSTWHALFNAVAAGQASYPIKVMDKADEPYYFNTALEFQTMYFTGFGMVGAILEGGRALKAQVNACTTKEQIDAIIDER